LCRLVSHANLWSQKLYAHWTWPRIMDVGPKHPTLITPKAILHGGPPVSHPKMRDALHVRIPRRDRGIKDLMRNPTNLFAPWVDCLVSSLPPKSEALCKEEALSVQDDCVTFDIIRPCIAI